MKKEKLVEYSNKKLSHERIKFKDSMLANFAASQGDLNEIKSLEAKGVDMRLIMTDELRFT